MWEPLSVKVTVFYVVFKILGKYRIIWLLGTLSENLGNIIWASAILLFLSWSTFPPLVISTYLFFKIPLHISFILIFSNREMLVNQIHLYLLLDSLWISLLEYNKCNVPLSIYYTLVFPSSGFKRRMASENCSVVTEFILLGLTDCTDLKMVLFALFLVIYAVTLVGNLSMIILIQITAKLHTTMYFFLSCL